MLPIFGYLIIAGRSSSRTLMMASSTLEGSVIQEPWLISMGRNSVDVVLDVVLKAASYWTNATAECLTAANVVR